MTSCGISIKRCTTHAPHDAYKKKAMKAYEQHLDKVKANYVPLTPISFLQRSAAVYPDKTAIIHGARHYSYRAFYRRSRQLASALARRGVGLHDTVSILAPNIPQMLEAHFAVPMLGAVLNTINYRLDANTLRFILQHAETQVLLTDCQFSATLKAALADLPQPPLVIDIDDPLDQSGGERLGEKEYNAFLAEGDADFAYTLPSDEWQAIGLSYTSGTTGNPKGVVTHHRGAYLNALGQLLAFDINANSRYLWTLPMFHCNGWTYTWGVTAAAATHICLRQVDPQHVFSLISEQRISHLCGAPVVLNMLIHAPEQQRRRFDHRVMVATGGAAPPSAVINAMSAMGFNIVHLYGLTETYGPATVCAWQEDWNVLDAQQQAQRIARQGVIYPTQESLMIADSETLAPIPWDGQTLGELMLRGNTVMKGYLKNEKATQEAFKGGWFHTGDLAVQHADGYIEIKDRSKDIIISGGENISSLEVEGCLYQHPLVMEAAVVAKPDPYWGESVCAFVTPVDAESDLNAEHIQSWCRERIAHYKVPRHVVFSPLPKTSTGKIQKFVLREQAKAL